VKYFLTILVMIFLTSCALPQERQLPYEVEPYQPLNFSINPTYENLQGIWGNFNENGDFEFLDILRDIVVHGQISNEGAITLMKVGGYHFHGTLAHTFYSLSLNTEGQLEEIAVHKHWAAMLSDDNSYMQFVTLADERALILRYLGQDTNAIDEHIGALILGSYKSIDLIEKLLENFVYVPIH